jgi:hypothetical protein
MARAANCRGVPERDAAVELAVQISWRRTAGYLDLVALGPGARRRSAVLDSGSCNIVMKGKDVCHVTPLRFRCKSLIDLHGTSSEDLARYAEVTNGIASASGPIILPLWTSPVTGVLRS